jgi:hypothetical protein
VFVFILGLLFGMYLPNPRNLTGGILGDRRAGGLVCIKQTYLDIPVTVGSSCFSWPARKTCI